MELSASMMCAKYENLKDEVLELDRAGIDTFHIDIMDGVYVPNLGMGLQDIKCIRKYTDKVIEAHLMVKNVDAYLHILKKDLVDRIYIHPEADLHPFTRLQAIKDMGIEPGIAIDPGSAIETVRELFNIAKHVIVMAVTPGFAGQSYLPFVADKIETLVSLKDKYNLSLHWDGCCKWDKIETFAPMGVDSFVLGSNILFGHDESYAELVKRVRHCGNAGM